MQPCRSAPAICDEDAESTKRPWASSVKYVAAESAVTFVHIRCRHCCAVDDLLPVSGLANWCSPDVVPIRLGAAPDRVFAVLFSAGGFSKMWGAFRWCKLCMSIDYA
jgi:hypothetical protein